MELGHWQPVPVARLEVSRHACPEVKGSNPATGLILLWVRNPFRGKF